MLTWRGLVSRGLVSLPDSPRRSCAGDASLPPDECSDSLSSLDGGGALSHGGESRAPSSAGAAAADADVAEELDASIRGVSYLLRTFETARVELDRIYARGSVPALLDQRNGGLRRGERAIFTGKEDESISFFTGTLPEYYFHRTSGVGWGTHQVLSLKPLDILVLRHFTGCSLADSPDDQVNCIPRTMVRVLQERHHRSVEASVDRSPVVLATPKGGGHAPICRGLLCEVLSITASLLEQKYGVSIDLEWLVVGSFGLRMPVNFGCRAGARFGSWIFRTLTVLDYDMRVAAPCEVAESWELHCFTRRANGELGVRNTLYPLYGSARSGTTKTNRPPQWGASLRQDAANEGVVDVELRVQALRSCVEAGEDLPLAHLEATLACAACSKEKTYSEAHDYLKTRLASPQPRHLSAAEDWLKNATAAACFFIQCLDEGSVVSSAYEVSFTPHVEGARCSFSCAVELSLYAYRLRHSRLGLASVHCTRLMYLEHLYRVVLDAQRFLDACTDAHLARSLPLEHVLSLADIVELSGHLALVAQAVGQCDGKVAAQERAWRRLAAHKQQVQTAAAAVAAAAATREAAAAEAAAAAAAREEVEGEEAEGHAEHEPLEAVDVDGLVTRALAHPELARILTVKWLEGEVRRRGLSWRESRAHGSGKKGRKLNKAELLDVLAASLRQARAGVDDEEPGVALGRTQPGPSPFDILTRLAEEAQAAAPAPVPTPAPAPAPVEDAAPRSGRGRGHRGRGAGSGQGRTAAARGGGRRRAPVRDRAAQAAEASRAEAEREERRARERSQRAERAARVGAEARQQDRPEGAGAPTGASTRRERSRPSVASGRQMDAATGEACSFGCGSRTRRSHTAVLERCAAVRDGARCPLALHAACLESREPRTAALLPDGVFLCSTCAPLYDGVGSLELAV